MAADGRELALAANGRKFNSAFLSREGPYWGKLATDSAVPYYYYIVSVPGRMGGRAGSACACDSDWVCSTKHAALTSCQHSPVLGGL